MRHSKSNFAALAIQAGRGDDYARQQLERDLAHVVRRVIQNGHAISPLDRRILLEADRHPDARSDQDALVRRVASSLCSSVIAAQRPSAETVANFSARPLAWSA